MTAGAARGVAADAATELETAGAGLAVPADFRRRMTWGRLAEAGAAGSAVVAILPLALLLGWLAFRGASALDLAFFTELPKPVGETGGGMANAIAGSLEVLALAALVAVPLGILTGGFMVEVGGGLLGDTVRFLCDVLSGLPAIVMGVYVYALLVQSTKHFSAAAGALSLAIIMLPIVARTVEEMLRLVPASLREAALALGAPRWKAFVYVALPAARAGIVTGCLVALARVAGEAAPLLFTAFGNRFWSLDPREPIATLPVQIFTYAIAPFDDWHRQAWAAALVLVGLVLALAVGARALTRERMTRGE